MNMEKLSDLMGPVKSKLETEKQIKKWSKAKKEALINGEFEKLPNLAKKKNFIGRIIAAVSLVNR